MMFSDYVDPNWCPECGLPRGVCTCGDDTYYDDDDYDWQDDPNCCPECCDDLEVSGDLIFCQNLECGWSAYLGDDDPEDDE